MKAGDADARIGEQAVERGGVMTVVCAPRMLTPARWPVAGAKQRSAMQDNIAILNSLCHVVMRLTNHVQIPTWKFLNTSMPNADFNI